MHVMRFYGNIYSLTDMATPLFIFNTLPGKSARSRLVQLPASIQYPKISKGKNLKQQCLQSVPVPPLCFLAKLGTNVNGTATTEEQKQNSTSYSECLRVLRECLGLSWHPRHMNSTGTLRTFWSKTWKTWCICKSCCIYGVSLCEIDVA